MHEFEPRTGGSFRMSLTYDAPEHAVPGKSGEHVDIVVGRFLALVPNEQVVELVTFDADDRAYAGVMTITTTLTAVPAGTEVVVACENVPPGITVSDHLAGISSSLANLARFTESYES